MILSWAGNLNSLENDEQGMFRAGRNHQEILSEVWNTLSLRQINRHKIEAYRRHVRRGYMPYTVREE